MSTRDFASRFISIEPGIDYSLCAQDLVEILGIFLCPRDVFFESLATLCCFEIFGEFLDDE
jgi:hypothetical protein